jgi:hypothetical protein
MPAESVNTPCSGSKRGVESCFGATFLCVDESISGSKRVCSMSAGGATTMTISATEGDCACRDGKLCVGKRGGLYCLSDSGAKSYLRD